MTRTPGANPGEDSGEISSGDLSAGMVALPPETQAILLKVAGILEDIDFGTVLLVVQDSKVVQIEMAEKFRLR